MQTDLTGRVAVVTGASRGIGRAIALALSRAGAKLAVLGRDQAKLAETQKLAREAGTEAETYVCDVREEAQVRKTADDVGRRLGAVHILVNNAGTTIRKPVVDFSFDEWRTVTDTNVTGVFLMCKYFVPHMRGHGYGRIINISSILAHVSSPSRGVYGATSHAIAGLTKALALELVEDGINCVAISPAFVATESTTPLRNDPQRSAWVLDRTPMRRFCKEEEIGALVLFICSDGASFMTGNDVLIDGGWCAQ